MRAIIAFEVENGPGAVEEVLRQQGWTLELPEGDSWRTLIARLPPVGAWDSQWTAWRLQTQVEHELARAEGQDLDPATLDDVRRARTAQNVASEAQRAAIEEQKVVLDRLAPDFLARGVSRDNNGEPKDLRALAASESELILGQIAAEDRDYALLTFQHPIYDRRTQTWGTVHYEPDHQQRHIVIRLRNSHSERLKRATQRLVAHLLGDVEDESRAARVRRLSSEIRALAHWLWYRKLRSDPMEFEPIKVLEPGSPREAFYGSVVSERTLGSVVRERRGDLFIAGIFGALGVASLLLESPLILDYDKRVHDLTIWHSGWLAWMAGNVGRLGTSLFVASFLPVIQVLLAWREVRRRPAVVWDLGD